jgi:hypothetical protein
MEHLQAGQTYGGQPGDLLVGHHGVAAGPRVGQHGDAAGRPDQADGAERVEGVPVHVGAAAVGDPVAGEGVAGRGDGAAGRHGPGDVRTADHGRTGDGRHLVPGDVHAKAGQPVHHGPGAQHAVVADAGEFGGQFGLIRVEQVGQHMQALLATGGRPPWHPPTALATGGRALKPPWHPPTGIVEPTGELHAGKQSRGGRQARLGVAGHGVVVGERHHVETGRRGAAHHLGRRIRPVRRVAVDVQVGPHQGADRRGEAAPKGRSRS